MKSTCRNLLSSSLAAALALGGLGLATTAAAQGNGNPPPEACGLLNNPNIAGKMDGRLRILASQCGRPEFVGQVRSEVGESPDIVAAAGTDSQVNDSASDTGTASTTQSETSISLNEVTGTLCSGFNDSYHNFANGTGFSGFSRSTDGGATWSDRGAIGSGNSGDPSIVWRRADGNFYFATLGSTGLRIYTSSDDCQSFSLVGNIHNGSGDDKEIIAVDNTVGSPFYGRIYNVWTDFGTGGDIRSTFSDNGGNTWSTPVNLTNNIDAQGAWPAVAPNGDVYVGWLRWNPFPNGPIDVEVVRSTNGGVSYSSVPNPLTGAVNPRDSAASSSCGRPALNGFIRYLPSPQLAVGSDGTVHIVYSYDDDGFNTGDVVNVFYRRSTNSGASWGPEIQINDDGTNTDQYFPSLSVGAATNIVTVAYYDRRNDVGNNLLIDYYARKSLDGGLTWNQPSVRMSDASTPVYLDPNLANCYHGDYDQQVQDANFAYIQWSDDRNIQNGHNDPDVFFDKEPVGTPAVCGDGSCDAGESECSCAADCGNPPASEAGFCADGLDNDCDGLADLDDPDCAPVCGDAVCEGNENQCNCAGDCGNPPATEVGFCNDGSDNDCDGLTDINDPDCAPVCTVQGQSCSSTSECCPGLKCKGGRSGKTCR